MIQNQIYKAAFIIFVLFSRLMGEEITHLYSFVNSSSARAVGMGSAFTAVKDGLAAVHFNPAAYVQYKYKKSHKFSFNLNPIGIGAAIDTKDDLTASGKLQGEHVLGALGLLFKSISFSTPAISIGLNLAESLPDNPWQNSKSRYDSKGLLDWSYNTLAFSVKLAEQVSMGASLYLVRAVERVGGTSQSLGSSYGVFVNPSEKFSVGVSYFNYPQEIAGLMFAQNRTVDESINVGIAFKPGSCLLLSGDVRNVSDETSSNKTDSYKAKIAQTSNEIHLGCELTISSLLALRSGYYRIDDEAGNVYSFGLGLFDTNILRNVDNQLAFKDFLLNYALQVEDIGPSINYQHFLTFLIRL